MRMTRSVLVVPAAAVIVGALGAPPAVAGVGCDLGVVTYTVEPDDGAPTVAVVWPDGSGQPEIDWPVAGAIVSRISPDGRQLVAATLRDGEDFGTVRPGISRLDGGHFHRLRVRALHPGATASRSDCSLAAAGRPTSTPGTSGPAGSDS